MSRSKAKSTPATGSQKLRIIGGLWRGRKLEFPDIPGLRPTPDRVRETLFNWLQVHIAGAHCADLFAGSGALGLEALSREAESVLFVDSSAQVINQLKTNLTMLQASQGRCQQADALRLLAQPPAQPLDIIFLDPPFRQQLLEPCCNLLEQGWLKPGSLIYVEVEKELRPLPVPSNWSLLKEKTAGQLTSYLFQWQKPF